MPTFLIPTFLIPTLLPIRYFCLLVLDRITFTQNQIRRKHQIRINWRGDPYIKVLFPGGSPDGFLNKRKSSWPVGGKFLCILGETLPGEFWSFHRGAETRCINETIYSENFFVRKCGIGKKKAAYYCDDDKDLNGQMHRFS